jgi:hypothetical protein
LLLALVIIVTAGAITREWWSWKVRDVYRRAQDRRQALPCMTYTMPADHVVWERAPQNAAALLKSPGYIQLRKADGTPLAVVEKMPALSSDVIFYNRGMPQNSAMVFLHERKFRGEHRMIVAVEYCAGRDGVGPHFASSLLEPGSFMRNERFKIPDVACRTEGVPLRITFGQPDPSDESHFAVRAIAPDGIEDVYDGWLGPPTFEFRQDDLAKVRMARRPRGSGTSSRPSR